MRRLHLVSILAAATVLAAAAVGVGAAAAADAKKSSGGSGTLQPGGIMTPQKLPKQPVVTLSAADLTPELHGPSQAMLGKKLGQVTVVVWNKGQTQTRSGYRLELFLKQGSTQTSLKSASGPRLAPDAKKKHLFRDIKLRPDIGAGSYQLCARVSGGGEGRAQQRNNESCSRMTLAAKGETRLRVAAPVSVKQAPAEPSGKGGIRKLNPTRTPSSLKPSATDSTRRAPSSSGPSASDSMRTNVAQGTSLGSSLTARPAVTAALDPGLANDMRQRLMNYQRLKRQRTEWERAAAAAAEHATRLHGVLRAGTDCNDHNDSIHPGATEACDGLDNDCDGHVDEGVNLTAYLDADGDGHGNPDVSLLACPADLSVAQASGAWLSQLGNDCDDTDPDRWHDCE